MLKSEKEETEEERSKDQEDNVLDIFDSDENIFVGEEAGLT